MFEKKFNTYTPAGYPPDKYDVLEEHQDVFRNELSINSFHISILLYGYFIQKYVIHENVPLDVIYKSNQSKESFYLTYNGHAKYLRLNIDGKYTMEMVADEDVRDSIDGGGRYYFEITKDQLYKLCMANSLAMQTSDYKDSTLEQCSADGLIPILQTIYNRVIDNSAFCDAKQKCIDYYKAEYNRKIAEIEGGKQEEENRNKWGWIMLIGGLIVTFIGILACCAMPYSVFGILCIVGGALIAGFSLVPFLQ